jgi:ABC-2 type transport system permease protein
MFRTLHIEWMKIKNYRVFQVFSVLYMLGIVVIIYIFYKIYMEVTRELMSMGNPDSPQAREGRDIFQLFSADAIWNTVVFWTSLLLYLPGMIIISLFINEVNFKTHRQNIIDGWKRETFIYTKIGLIICICLVVTLMNILATFIMCQVTGIEFSLLSGLDTLALCFIQAFVYLMFALLLATFFRKSGVAIIVFFIYGLILEFPLMWLFSKIVPGMQYFLPLQIADSLIPFPQMRQFYADLPGLPAIVTGALAFLGLYIFLTVRKYKVDDL